MSNAINGKKIILEGIVGSQAYGLATPDSDEDRLGIFQKELHDMVSLNPGDDTYVQHEPDVTYHELNKFISLSYKNNPTVLELLWLNDWTVLSEAGLLLIENRRAFLSQQVRNTYGGYAMQQKERLMRRGDFASDLKKRTEKHGRHCFRLLIQGIYILRHGEIRVRLTDDEILLCRMAGEKAATDPDTFAKMFDTMDWEFKNTPSDLPAHPDIEEMNEIIWQARGMDY